MNTQHAAFPLKGIFTTIAMAAVATMGIIATGSVDEALLDAIQAW